MGADATFWRGLGEFARLGPSNPWAEDGSPMTALLRPLRRLAGTFTLALGVGLSGAALAGPVIDRITETGEVRFGFRTDAPPFAAMVEGRPQGFTVDLCALLAQAIKETTDLDALTARFAPIDTGQRFEAIVAGDIDVLCGATTATLTRRETVSFSLPIFHTGVSVVMNSAAPDLAKEVLLEPSPAAFSETAVNTALKGLKLGVRRGTTAGDWLEKTGVSGSADVETIEYDTHEAGIAAVKSGEISGYFADQAILLGQLKALEDGTGLLLSKKSFTHEPYALALPRGDEDFRLLIDRALSHLYRTQRVIPLLEYHFGPVAPQARNFYRMISLPE